MAEVLQYVLEQASTNSASIQDVGDICDFDSDEHQRLTPTHTPAPPIRGLAAWPKQLCPV